MGSLSRTRAVPVSARPANYLAVVAEIGNVELCERAAVQAGAYVHDGPALSTRWHSHEMHQLEYACHGTVSVETAYARFVLPPHQAAWIPAGLQHISTLGDARTISIFLSPDLVDGTWPRARVLAMSPLLREMVLYAERWPITRVDPDPIADAFFVSLALLLPGWIAREAPFALPVSGDPLVASAINYTQDHLQDVTPAAMSRAVGASERTLRRRFAAETSMSWRDYLTLARILKAVALLATPGPTILEVATTVGFESATAFTRAFTRHTGETPSGYRRRINRPQEW